MVTLQGLGQRFRQAVIRRPEPSSGTVRIFPTQEPSNQNNPRKFREYVIRKILTVSATSVDRITINLPKDAQNFLGGIGYNWNPECDYFIFNGYSNLFQGENQLGSLSVPKIFSPPHRLYNKVQFIVNNRGAAEKQFHILFIIQSTGSIVELSDIGTTEFSTGQGNQIAESVNNAGTADTELDLFEINDYGIMDYIGVSFHRSVGDAGSLDGSKLKIYVDGESTASTSITPTDLMRSFVNVGTRNVPIIGPDFGITAEPTPDQIVGIYLTSGIKFLKSIRITTETIGGSGGARTTYGLVKYRLLSRPN